MKKINVVSLWCVYALLLCLVSCTARKVETGDFHVIPLPQEIVEGDTATPFILRPSTAICYPVGNEKWNGQPASWLRMSRRCVVWIWK